jgi:hypothetical protein
MYHTTKRWNPPRARAEVRASLVLTYGGATAESGSGGGERGGSGGGAAGAGVRGRKWAAAQFDVELVEFSCSHVNATLAKVLGII